MARLNPFLIAVTGAQGVGKSTFCRELMRLLHNAGYAETRLFDGIGDRMKAMGIPLGSTSTQNTIFAIWASHLEREDGISDGLGILDRCLVDALAYTRALNLTSELEDRVLEKTAKLAVTRIGLVIHLELSLFFATKGAPHETPELRRDVAHEISNILVQFDLPRIDLDASDEGSLPRAVAAIVEVMGRD